MFYVWSSNWIKEVWEVRDILGKGMGSVKILFELRDCLEEYNVVFSVIVVKNKGSWIVWKKSIVL